MEVSCSSQLYPIPLSALLTIPLHHQVNVKRGSFYCSQEDLALRHTAIAWLGALLRDQFPSLQPLGGSVTPAGILYRMVGKGSFDETILPILNERLRVRLLDALREDEGVTSSREMLHSNAVGFFQHRKESVLAHFLQQEAEEAELPVDELLPLLHIGKHVEPVPFPHAPSISLLRHLYITSLESTEMELQGRPRQVWVFHARIPASSQDVKKWNKQTRQKKKQKNLLWVHLEETDQIIWTAQGTELRLQLLEEWRKQLKELEVVEIVTQGEGDDESHSYQSTEKNLAQECAQWFKRMKACGLACAAECRITSAEESSIFPYVTSPEALLTFSRDALHEKLSRYLPLLFKFGTSENSNMRLLLLSPQKMDAATRLCVETVKERVEALFPNLQVTVEQNGETAGLLFLSLLLSDQEGGEWFGPSLTFHTHYKPAFPHILLFWKAFGTLEQWIALREIGVDKV